MHAVNYAERYCQQHCLIESRRSRWGLWVMTSSSNMIRRNTEQLVKIDGVITFILAMTLLQAEGEQHGVWLTNMQVVRLQRVDVPVSIEPAESE